MKKMKMYKTGQGYINGLPPRAYIREVEVDRVTDKSIFANGRREGRYVNYSQYHETWEDAWNYLREKSEEAIAYAEKKLKIAQEAKSDVLAMRSNQARMV